MSGSLLRAGVLAWILVGLGSVCQGQPSAIFPFQLPWDDRSATVTDLSFLNAKPAGAQGNVRVGADGHLYSGDRRIRFLGVNFTNQACFPQHADAELIAGRLAKFGVNVVRFHLMDADWGTSSIFDLSGPGTRTLDAGALDRLDYFVARLKDNGIYSDINLLTGRNFSSADGVDPAIDSMDWKAKQTPALFDPALIALQKEYASQLLGHLNPYTDLTYSRDPAVAFVEIVNEHGLLHAWQAGLIDDLPAYFAEELQAAWNGFLVERYGTQTNLSDHWTQTTDPGPQMLQNPDFSAGLQGWTVEQHDPARATAAAGDAGPGGQPSLRVQVTVPGTQNWHVQLNQGGLGVQAGVVYTLSFWARADRAATISVQLEQAHDPWQGLGLDRPVGVDTSWQHFQYSFVLNADEANARLNFRDLADETATYWFAGLALARGGTIGLLPGEDLGAASIRIVLRSEADLRNAQGRQDWCEFLWKTEESYWTQMRRHLRETVGTDALLIGTVVGTSTPNLMNLFDVIDSHAYWQHPSFESDWGSPWWIRNDSMVVDPQGGTIPGLALKRIYGKPFSVSEYNHPFPNSFGSEGFLFLAAYGALQDWDAIYGYTYSDGNLDWSGDFQTGYFDLHRNPGKMISLFHAACLFRRGDLSAARRLVVGRLTSQEEIALLPGAPAWRLLDGRDAGIPPPAALLHRTALEVDGTVTAPDPLDPNSVEIPDDRRFESDTAEITWDSPLRVLRIDSPGSKGLIGYVVGQSFTLGDFEIAPINSLQGWAAIFLSRLTSDGPTRRYVVSTHGLVQNHGQQWREYPSGLPVGLPPPAGANLTLGSWGSAPVEVEAITCDIRLPFPPEKLSVYALDGTGARRTPVPLESDGEGTRFRLSPEFETLWYEIVLADLESRRAVAGFETGPGDFVGLSLTNPVDQDAAVRLALYPAAESGGPELLLDTVLPANSQSAKLLPEWFGTASIPARGWIEVASDQPAVSAMAQCGDSRLDRLDGVPAVAGSASPVLLTRVCDGPRHFRGQAVSTWVSVANLAPVPTRVELILKVPAEPGGPVSRLVEAGRTTVALDGERSIVKTAGELFDTAIENGCIEVRPLDASAVAAGEVVELLERDTIFALNGAAPLPVSRLYSPQVAALPGYLFSSIRLINTATSSRTVTLRAFGDSGQSLAPPVTIDLPADGLFEQDAGLLFQSQFGIEASLIGSLVVEVGGDGGVMGDIVFGLADLGYAAASPLQSAGYRHASLGQVANLPGLFFTGLALFNPGDDAVVVRIEVRGTEGSLRGFFDCALPARGRISDLIANLLPATERQVGGYILLSSDRDFLAQELWGTASLSLLSAIPAQAFE